MRDLFLSINFVKDTLNMSKIACHISKLEVTAGESFPLIKRLISIASTLPISNAEIERTFSQLKIILTDNRKRLKVDTVNKLMMIKINDGNDYLLKAVKKWKNAKVRRLY